MQFENVFMQSFFNKKYIFEIEIEIQKGEKAVIDFLLYWNNYFREKGHCYHRRNYKAFNSFTIKTKLKQLFF